MYTQVMQELPKLLANKYSAIVSQDLNRWAMLIKYGLTGIQHLPSSANSGGARGQIMRDHNQ